MQPLQITSIIVVLKCLDKFLLVQRSENDDIFPGKWQNMGGKIEIGETVEKALKNEAKVQPTPKYQNARLNHQSKPNAGSEDFGHTSLGG